MSDQPRTDSEPRLFGRGGGAPLGTPNDTESVRGQQHLRVVIGSPVTIFRGPEPDICAGHQMIRLANGDIVVPMDRWEGGKVVESWAMISADGGKTWRRARSPWTGGLLGQLRDGTILMMAGTAEGPPQEPGVFSYRAVRGQDTWESLEPTTVIARVAAVQGTGDDLQPFYGMFFWNRIVEMPNGDLLVTAYGYFEGDNEPIDVTWEPYREQAYGTPGFNKTRVVLLRSVDQGRSWDYVTTVSYDPSSGEEGPSEPSLTRTHSGDLVCIMRTGRVNALRVSRSSDGGVTWTPLELIPGTIGVAPFLITMQDGTLACVYGMKDDYWRFEHRRELRVMFSFDGGGTWPLNEIIYAGEAGSYPSICEVAPGRLIAAFNPSSLLARQGQKERLFVCIVPIRLKQAPVYKWP